MRRVGAGAAAVDGGYVLLDVGDLAGEDVGAGEVGHDVAGVEEDDARGEEEGFVEVVGDEEDGFGRRFGRRGRGGL